MIHPGVAFMRMLALLPLPAVRGLGAALGHLLYWVLRSRRRVALVNLRLCFPELGERARRRLVHRNFVVFCQAALDRSWVWHAPADVLRKRIRIEGNVDDLTREGAVVLFAPHFYGMDAGGSAIMLQVDRPGCTIYSSQPSRVLDAWIRAGRSRFGDITLVSRQDGVRAAVRALRQGRMLYLLPDMDLGRPESVFVPFFGVPAATVPVLPRLARLGNARVVPVITRMTRDGYAVRIHPAWQDYPTDDATADTARMNLELQRYIEAMPEQYYWVHRRFKTRPEGEPPVY
ncbi:MAG: lipid A biosynthesis acyltransferase [Ottowia sp.]|nr:lipid A biosynthesis acyltransferase [Ottowia sp.]